VANRKLACGVSRERRITGPSSATTLPSARTITWSATRLESGRMCVERRSAPFFYDEVDDRFEEEFGATPGDPRPEVGSSRRSSAGLCASAWSTPAWPARRGTGSSLPLHRNPPSSSVTRLNSTNPNAGRSHFVNFSTPPHLHPLRRLMSLRT